MSFPRVQFTYWLCAFACVGLFACATPSGEPGAVGSAAAQTDDDEDSSATSEMVCKNRRKSGTHLTERVCVPRVVRDEGQDETQRRLRDPNIAGQRPGATSN